ncbi:MAG TPA: hypothetical protein VLS89_12330, partial [Candidatus Nanopelagicales bacterium]|nr:hypothetical protein [Candidatus Nanopelagicales bacterium]
MHNRYDQFAKNMLRDVLSAVATVETEVEVTAPAQKIDVYLVPDPACRAERAAMGLLGALASEPSLFEPFHKTPGLRQFRHCIRKQLTWHHELESRARNAAAPARPQASQGADAPSQDAALDAPGQPSVPFPALVIISPGWPETALEAYGCTAVTPGLY